MLFFSFLCCVFYRIREKNATFFLFLLFFFFVLLGFAVLSVGGSSERTPANAGFTTAAIQPTPKTINTLTEEVSGWDSRRDKLRFGSFFFSRKKKLELK